MPKTSELTRSDKKSSVSSNRSARLYSYNQSLVYSHAQKIKYVDSVEKKQCKINNTTVLMTS